MSRRPIKSKRDFDSQGSREEFISALQLFNSIVQQPDLQKLLQFDMRTSSNMVYTHGVTLWMLILQRLNGGATLEQVIQQVLTHNRDLFPANRRVEENTLSENSAAYSQARKRLPLEVIFEFSNAVCNYLGEISPRIIEGLRVFLLDGTTITLPPTKALREAFPPASNQHGESVWPVAQLMLANELQSGCALLPQIDPMYGENNVSEAVQAHRIVTQLPANSLVMADAGFGVFSVAYHTVGAKHEFLFRLTRSRFKALRRRADLIDEGPTHQSYRLLWTPSAKDRRSNPDLPPEASIEAVLHAVTIKPGVILYLVSTLELDGPTAAGIYSHRYDIEFDIRDVKVTLDTENIRAKSVEMVKKELYTSIVAYNLVAQFRRQAAKRAGVQPRRLRFKGIWTTFQYRLLLQSPCSVEEWMDRFEEALYHASKKKHPNRKAPRNYERKAHPRRPKSTKFEKAQRKKNKQPNEGIPPPMAVK
jgi:hypothetical protein